LTVTSKYDPLWELAGQKVPLHGIEADVDSRCPFCHVVVHLGSTAKVDDEVECGLCGEPLVVVKSEGTLAVARRP
jgi:hypothetical protein